MDINRVNNNVQIDNTLMNNESSDQRIEGKIPWINTENMVGDGNNEEPTLKEIEKAVDKINKVMEDEHIYAKYEVHDKLNRIMITLINQDTKEVILEVPPKKFLDMIAKMCEMAGVLIDKKA